MVNDKNMKAQDGLFSEFISRTAKHFRIPGVAAAVWHEERELYASYGVTSTENPLPVDQHTLFILGSVSKTYTATAMMYLVSAGKVDLHTPVTTYLPELELSDQEAKEKINILHLLNHTSGLDWGLIEETGEGADALAQYVAKMAGLKQLASPGARVSYSQAGYNLAGRIIEKVAGLPFEQAVASLLFEPLELNHSFYQRDDIMTRRFSVGHNRTKEDRLEIARLWRRSRGDNPGGGIASSAADQLRWARFHLADGCGQNGVRLLPQELLGQMQQPTAELRASNLGQAVGIGWFLREIDGVQTICHNGSANGQFADLVLVPEKNFAVVALSNAGPDGIAFNQAVIRRALLHYLQLSDHDPKPIAFSAEQAGDLAGLYENEVMMLSIKVVGSGLLLEVLIKPEIRLAADKELPPDHAPFEFGLLPGDKDEYIITSGAFEGQRGFFTRDARGSVSGVDLAGRLFSRVT